MHIDLLKHRVNLVVVTAISALVLKEILQRPENILDRGTLRDLDMGRPTRKMDLLPQQITRLDRDQHLVTLVRETYEDIERQIPIPVGNFLLAPTDEKPISPQYDRPIFIDLLVLPVVDAEAVTRNSQRKQENQRDAEEPDVNQENGERQNQPSHR